MLEASFRYGKGGVGEPQAYSFQKFLTIIYIALGWTKKMKRKISAFQGLPPIEKRKISIVENVRKLNKMLKMTPKLVANNSGKRGGKNKPEMPIKDPTETTKTKRTIRKNFKPKPLAQQKEGAMSFESSVDSNQFQNEEAKGGEGFEGPITRAMARSMASKDSNQLDPERAAMFNSGSTIEKFQSQSSQKFQ